MHSICPLMHNNKVTTITAGTIDKVLKLHINIKLLLYSNIEQSIKAFSLAKQVKSPFATQGFWKFWKFKCYMRVCVFMCVFRYISVPLSSSSPASRSWIVLQRSPACCPICQRCRYKIPSQQAIFSCCSSSTI